MRFHVISFTKNGFSLAKKIQNLLAGEEVSVDCAFSSLEDENFPKVSLSEWTKIHFQKDVCLIFVGAAGIAVRAVAPFVKDKANDPAVLVIDEKGGFVIPILSGHIGGANEIARRIASKLTAQAVITTASDVNGLNAIDEFAAKNNLAINDMNLAKEFAAKKLAGESVRFSVSVYIKNDILNLIPKCVVLGIGCKKGKEPEELESFVRGVLHSNQIDIRSVEKIASIDLKIEENALVSLAKKLAVPFCTFSADELNGIPQKVSHSEFVSKITGTDNVCERAVFAAGAESLLVQKTSQDGMTVAVGVRKIDLEIPNDLKEHLL